MRKLLTLAVFTASLLIIMSTFTLAQGYYFPGPGIYLSITPSVERVALGTTVTYHLTAYDIDGYGDPQNVDDSLEFEGWPGPTPVRGLPEQPYESIYSVTYNEDGQHDFTVTADDTGSCADDPDVSVTVRLAVGDITLDGAICVSPDGLDTNSGLNWAHPKKKIQAAVDSQEPNGEIWVKAGEHDCSAYGIHIIKDLKLYGGFTGTETQRDSRDLKNNATIISTPTDAMLPYAMFVSPPVGSDNIPIGPDVNFTLNGFTFKDCRYAGLSVSHATANITNNVFKNCSGTYGGAINLGPCTNANITGNMIVDNQAQRGGGVYLASTSSGLAINNNTIVNNTATVDGGGIYAEMAVSGTAKNNIIAFNTGGGIKQVPGAALSLSKNCVYGNTAYQYLGVSGINDIEPPDLNVNPPEPMFADFAGKDYHLASGSRCIDKGDDSVVQTGAVDIDGEPRNIDIPDVPEVGTAKVDIGADEMTCSISDLLNLAPGANVIISNEICTAGNDKLDGEFYIEEADRSTGIRVKYTGTTTVPAGKLVSVTGHVDNDSTCNEWTLYADIVTVGEDATVPEPVVKTNHELGGNNRGSAIGVTGALPGEEYNKGLLVETKGTVIDWGPDGIYVVVDDGTATESGGVRVALDRLLLGHGIALTPFGEMSIRGICSSAVVDGNTIRVVRPRSVEDTKMQISFVIPPQPLTGTQPIQIKVRNFVPPLSQFTLDLDENLIENADIDAADYQTGDFMLNLNTVYLSDEYQHTIHATATDAVAATGENSASIETARDDILLESSKHYIQIDDGSGGELTRCTITATLDPAPLVNTAVQFLASSGTFTDVTTTDGTGHATAVFHAGTTPGPVNILAVCGSAGGNIELFQSGLPAEVLFVTPDYYVAVDPTGGCTGKASVMVYDTDGNPAADGLEVNYSYTNGVQTVTSTPTAEGLSTITFKSTASDDGTSVITAVPNSLPMISATSNINIVWPDISLTVPRFAPVGSGAAITVRLEVPKDGTTSGLPIQFHWEGDSGVTFAPSANVVIDATGSASVQLVSTQRASGRVWATYGESTPFSELIDFTSPDCLYLRSIRSDTPDKFEIEAILKNYESLPIADGTTVTLETTAGWFNVNGQQATTVVLPTASEYVNADLNIPSGTQATVTASTSGLEARSIIVRNDVSAPAINVSLVEPLAFNFDFASVQSIPFTVRLTDAVTDDPIPTTDISFLASGGSLDITEVTTCDGLASSRLTVSSLGDYIVQITAPNFTHQMEFSFTGAPHSMGDIRCELDDIAGSLLTNGYDVSVNVYDAAGELVGSNFFVEFLIDGSVVDITTTQDGTAQTRLNLDYDIGSVSLQARAVGYSNCHKEMPPQNLSNQLGNIAFAFDSRNVPFTISTECEPQQLVVCLQVNDINGNPVPDGTAVTLSVDYGGFTGGDYDNVQNVTLSTWKGKVVTCYVAPCYTLGGPTTATLEATAGTGSLERTDEASINLVL